MRGCLCRTRLVLHQRRDKGGNTHNFPFDTLTKVYRDSMYATQERYLSNPMHPERGPQIGSTPAAPQVASPSSNVTNHVGNIGVMSAAATPLSEWKEELCHQDDHHHHAADGCDGEGQDGHQQSHITSSPTSSKHTRIVRTALSGEGSAAPASVMGDEEVRGRLRAHMFSSKKGNGKGRAAHGDAATGATAVAAGPRHSGVQVEILSIYRSMLREVKRMEHADTRRNLTAYIRSEFDKHRGVPRKNILKIEWQLNYGKRKLEDLQAMGRNTRFTMMR